MNTLKPLLIVAVLAGIGYGVYIRLNSGNGAPPPAVAEGWDTTPNVQLPDQASTAPWGPPSAQAPDAGPWGQSPTAGPPPSNPPPATGAPGFQAPPIAGAPPSYTPPAATPPTAAGPLGSGPPVAAAPPYDQTAANQAPPYAGESQPPMQDPASGPSGATPYENSPPAGPAPGTPAPTGPGGALVDPYAESHDRAPPGGYQAPPPQGAPASESAPPASYPPAPGQAPPGGQPPAEGSGEFAAVFAAAQRELEGGHMAEALRQLSKWYDRPELSPAEQQELNQLLDQVAGTVVYSTQNLVEPPYEVQPGERLEDIGEKYNVPWQLLAKINGLDDPTALRPGERLKVVRGPFQAIVRLEKRELTLFAADGSYAGRFKIGIGGEHPPREGTFPVAEKVPNPVYYGRDRAIGAEDVQNPLGERWIGLGGGIGIHGTNNPESIGRADLPGSISLSEPDAEDVYDILSLGSRVTIRR